MTLDLRRAICCGNCEKGEYVEEFSIDCSFHEIYTEPCDVCSDFIEN